MSYLEVRIPTGEYRAMPIPGQTYKGRPSKMSSCFVRVSDVPSSFEDWMDVNPRIPALKKDRKKLAGTVARRIVATLRENPGIFALKNQGIFLLVDTAEYVKEKGGESFITLKLRDKERHGIANGGHTFYAIQEAIAEGCLGESEEAWVRLHILEQVDPENLTELAEGLNRSLQVDDASLMNLEKRFDALKTELADLPGADEIAYRMGDTGLVDVQEVLSYVAAFNLDVFPDHSKQPNSIFGQPAKVLKLFDDPKLRRGFDRLMPHVHEILVLWDRVHEECAKYSARKPRIALLNRRKGKNNQELDPRPALFAEGRTIDRRIFNGLVFPILSAYRANVSQTAWKAGRFEWIIDPDELLTTTVDELCDVVRQAYKDLNGDPAGVGKKSAAYLSCYQAVRLKILDERAG